jgi:hypothetical protein
MPSYHRFNRKGNYTILSNDVLRQEGLGFFSTGILAYVATHSHEWAVSRADLCRRGGAGKGAIDTALRELKEKGYCRVVCETRCIRGKKQPVKVWEWTEVPFQFTPDCRRSEFSTVENTDPIRRTTISEEQYHSTNDRQVASAPAKQPAQSMSLAKPRKTKPVLQRVAIPRKPRLSEPDDPIAAAITKSAKSHRKAEVKALQLRGSKDVEALWSMACRKHHEMALTPWVPKERGMMGALWRKVKADKGDDYFVGMLRWCLEHWEALRVGRFSWMSKKSPPEFPEPSFFTKWIRDFMACYDSKSTEGRPRKVATAESRDDASTARKRRELQRLDEEIQARRRELGSVKRVAIPAAPKERHRTAPQTPGKGTKFNFKPVITKYSE